MEEEEQRIIQQGVDRLAIYFLIKTSKIYLEEIIECL
jgi:hypothetical protein